MTETCDGSGRRRQAALGRGRAFLRRHGGNGKRVDLAGELLGKNLIDHAMTLDARLAREGWRYHFDGEMALAGSGRAAMAGVAMKSLTTSSASGAKACFSFRLISSSTPIALAPKSLTDHHILVRVQRAILVVTATASHNAGCMKLNSKFFDRLRVKPDENRSVARHLSELQLAGLQGAWSLPRAQGAGARASITASASTMCASTTSPITISRVSPTRRW